MKNALLTVPYLKEVIIGGELAKLAFNYLKDHASATTKSDLGAAYASIKGRFSAFS